MILVAGATGYLGQPLHASASARGAAKGTSRTDKGFLPLRLEAPGDFDYGAVAADDTVFMTAGISAPDVCARERRRARAINVAGTSAAVSGFLSRGARVVFFSSDTVYGEKTEEFDESAPCDPVGDYAAMKHEVETRFMADPAFKTIRLSLVFSRDDRFTMYLRGCAERREEAGLFHPFRRSVVHRDDVVEGALALAWRWDEFPHGAINFGGPDVVDRLEFAEILKEGGLPGLRFRRAEPAPGFFRGRPRTIEMVSPVLASLLGRAPNSLREAVALEFGRGRETLA